MPRTAAMVGRCNIEQTTAAASAREVLRLYYRGGGSETRFFLGAAVSHLEGTKTNQRAAVWESTGPPPWLRGGIWLYPDEHNQF